MKRVIILTMYLVMVSAGYVQSDSTGSMSEMGADSEEDLPVLTEQSTLEDYLKYAALNNPGLKAAFNRWKSAMEKIPQVRSLPDPRFTYSYFIREVETRVGPQKHKLGIAQMFPWFGKLQLQADRSLQAANAEKERFESAKLKLFNKLKNVYYEYYYLGRAIAISEENKYLLTYFEEVARAKYEVGTADHSSIIKAQVELGKLEDHVSALKDLLNPVRARLNAALNRDSAAELPIPQQISQEDVEFTDDQILMWLKEHNPELKAIDYLAEKERIAIDLARKNKYPNLTFGIDYIVTGDSIMPDTQENGKDPIMAMVSINLPLWKNKYRAEENEAALRYRTNLESRIDKENMLIADMKMALYRFRDSERKIDLYRNTLIPKAEQALSVTQQAFIADKTDFLDLIDAQRTLLEFQLSYERALSNRAQHLAEIEEVSGHELSRSYAIIHEETELSE